MKLFSSIILFIGTQAVLGAAVPVSSCSSSSTTTASTPSTTYPANLPRATINNGEVIVGSSLANNTVEAYRGIPYAQPPVGDLRFHHPLPFNGTYNNLNATDFGKSCYGVPLNTSGFAGSSGLGPVSEEIGLALVDLSKDFPQSEDCLFLNVYRPKNIPANKKLPVMVWYHGGGFYFGSSSNYKGESIVSASINIDQPVIYVSANYRLGPWGGLGGEQMLAANATNSGFLDQRTALEWVSDHIADFGGDPDNVTIFGESSGAMSTALHMTYKGGDNSYKGRSLFHRAIMQSGGLLPFSNVTSKAPQNAYNTIVNITGCSQSKDQIDCLRKADNEVLHNFTISMNPLLSMISFSPRTDNVILTDPYVAFQEGKFTHVPYITGNQEDEGTIFVITVAKQFESLLNSDSNSTLSLFLETFFPNISPNVSQELDKLYPIDPAAGSPFRTFGLNALEKQSKRISAVLTDVMFQSPRRYMVEHTPSTVPVYTFLGSTGYGTPYLGTFHTSDLIWQYELNYGPAKVYNPYFISFANSGNPNGYEGLPAWAPHSNSSNNSIQINLDHVSFIPDDFRAQGIALLSDPSVRA